MIAVPRQKALLRAESGTDKSTPIEPPKIYIYHGDHERDRIYTENVVQYLESQGTLCRALLLNSSRARPELELCLDDAPTAVLGYNSQLDHSWLPSGSFLSAAESRNIPVIQWILDHPSSRWHEFNTSISTNSRFLLNSGYEQRYFHQYCMSGAMTATMGGLGPNRRSRTGSLSRDAFTRRPILCLVSLSLKRNGRSIEQTAAEITALDDSLARAVRTAIEQARVDLTGPLDVHLAAALATRGCNVPNHTFNFCYQLVEESVQTFRRFTILKTARKYPVLIQSDETATPFVHGNAATFATNVGLQLTLARIPFCRAVLSVSPVNDMVHGRTMNALNGGCVAIAEDSIAHKSVLEHGRSALLFRYDDRSLEECLDIVCYQPDRAYEIAQAGMELRDQPGFWFDEFRNIIDLAKGASTSHRMPDGERAGENEKCNSDPIVSQLTRPVHTLKPPEIRAALDSQICHGFAQKGVPEPEVIAAARPNFSMEVPFQYRPSPPRWSPRLAVMCHLFYEELAPEFQRYFQNISFPFDTFITTDKTSKRSKIESFFSGWQFGAVDVRIAENRGRDIAPKLVALKDVYEKYDYVLHVHSKRSVHSSPLANWRQFLLENLVGSPDVVNSVFDAFWRKSDLGMVACQHFEPIREEIIWRGNFKSADVLAKKMGISLSSDAPLDFPAGSMFWARTAALKPLLELKLRFDEFAQETGQRDGTLAHAIERLYFFACERAGFNWIKIARPELFTKTAGILKIDGPEVLDKLIIQNRFSLITAHRYRF